MCHTSKTDPLAAEYRRLALADLAVYEADVGGHEVASADALNELSSARNALRASMWKTTIIAELESIKDSAVTEQVFDIAARIRRVMTLIAEART